MKNRCNPIIVGMLLVAMGASTPSVALDNDTKEALQTAGIVALGAAGVTIIYKLMEWFFRPSDAEVLQQVRADLISLNSGYVSLYQCYAAHVQARATVQSTVESLCVSLGANTVLALTDSLGSTVASLKQGLSEVNNRKTSLERRLRKKNEPVLESVYQEFKDVSVEGVEVLVRAERLLQFLRAHREYLMLDRSARAISSTYAHDISLVNAGIDAYLNAMNNAMMNHKDVVLSKYPCLAYAQKLSYECSHYEYLLAQAQYSHSYMNLEPYRYLLTLLNRMHCAVLASERYTQENMFKAHEEREQQKISLEKEKLALERKKLEQQKKEHELRKAELALKQENAQSAQQPSQPLNINLIIN